MHKKYFAALSVFFIASFSMAANGKNVSSFIKKYNLPENITVLSVFGEDCVNCYYGFSYFLKEHKTDFKKDDFIFVFQKTAENEIDNIFKFRLGLEKKDYKIIVDDNFYACVNTNGVTTLSVVKNKKIKKQFTSRNISQFNSFAKIAVSPQAFNMLEEKSLDLKKLYGTKKLSITAINEPNVLVHNKYTNDLSVFNIKQEKITKTLPLTVFTGIYDSILPLLLLDDIDNLNYNLKNYKANDYYKTFPLCSIKKTCYSNGFIYVCLTVSRMLPDTNHITHSALFAMVKLDTNLQIQHIFKIPDSIPNSDKRISFFDCIFIAPEAAVVSLSVSRPSQLRKRDSVCAIYSLKTNETHILNMSYESFMPSKGSNGYSNYFHFDMWNENNVLKGYFNQSPYVYNLSNDTKVLIPDIGVDPKTIDITGKDKFFWINKIFPYQNSMLVIANQKQNEASILQYDIDLKTLVSKKKIFDGYFSDVFVVQNKIFAFENYSEKGDVATLHIYKLE